jgi:hypothetical protein
MDSFPSKTTMVLDYRALSGCGDLGDYGPHAVGVQLLHVRGLVNSALNS